MARWMIDLALQECSIGRYSGGLGEEPGLVGSFNGKKPLARAASNRSWRARIGSQSFNP